MIAISFHLCCFIYSVTTKAGYETPLLITFKRVSFQNQTIDHPYYTITEKTQLYGLSVVFLHGIVALVTFLFHIFVYLPIHYKYSDIIWKQGYFTARWIEYSITCTLMTLSSALSSGMNDLPVIIGIIFGGVALQVIGCLIEQMKHQWKILLLVGVLIEVNIGFCIVWYTLSSTASNAIQWLDTVTYLFYYSLFPVNCMVDALYRKNCFIKTDWTYNVLSLSSKFGLFWIQIGEVERSIYDSTWSYVQIYVFGTALPLLLLIGGLYFTPHCVQTNNGSRVANTNNTRSESEWPVYKRISSFNIVAIDRSELTRKTATVHKSKVMRAKYTFAPPIR